MEIIDLKPPKPFAKLHAASIFEFQTAAVIKIPKVTQHKLRPLADVLNARQSRRQFKTSLTLQQLGDLLWHSCRTIGKKTIAPGMTLRSKPSPSGGGCHPIHLLVMNVTGFKNDILRYDSDHHALGICQISKAQPVRDCLHEVDTCLKVNNGTVIWFVADLACSGQKYKHPESLAWRDSGAVLAIIGIAAEGMGLQCCGLGLHDIPSARRFLGLKKSVIGVGGCIVSG